MISSKPSAHLVAFFCLSILTLIEHSCSPSVTTQPPLLLHAQTATHKYNGMRAPHPPQTLDTIFQDDGFHPPQPTPLQSKKKGLSLDEKREKMLEIFHETKDVFVLKVGHTTCGNHAHVPPPTPHPPRITHTPNRTLKSLL